jgi:hypothetical protein
MSTANHSMPGLITVWEKPDLRIVTAAGVLTWVEWLHVERDRTLAKGINCRVVSIECDATGKNASIDGKLWALQRVLQTPPG